MERFFCFFLASSALSVLKQDYLCLRSSESKKVINVKDKLFTAVLMSVLFASSILQYSVNIYRIHLQITISMSTFSEKKQINRNVFCVGNTVEFCSKRKHHL